MLGARRAPITIIGEILKQCLEGSYKYAISSKCMLYWERMIKYVNHLVERGLLEERGDRYYTTEKGRVTLKHIKIVRELVGL